MKIKDRKSELLLILYLFSNKTLTPVELKSEFLIALEFQLNKKTETTLKVLELDGFVAKAQGSESSYHLTELGFDELCLRFPFFRYSRWNWDGVYRILSYEIPEKKRELRDKLRREVSGWGLGPWHRSFWITPHPIVKPLRQLIANKEEEKYVQAFEANHSFGDSHILVEKVWGIKKLEAEYRKLFKVWHEILSGADSNNEKIKKIVNNYVELLNIDPGLPKELIGENWIGFESYDIFLEIKEILIKG